MRKIVTLFIGALWTASCFSGFSDDAPARRELAVRRGDLHQQLILSGELEAARGEQLTVPRLPTWETSIRWVAEDGATVHAGDSLVEFDNTALTTNLDARRQSAMQAAQELQQREAEWSADLEERRLDVDKKVAEVETAEIDAKVPQELLSSRAFEQKTSALRRARTELAKAKEVLRSRQTGVDAERRNLLLTLDKTNRDIAVAEAAISALVVKAPRDGIFVLKDHPWEARKFQVGDTVWVGVPIGLMPDLSTMRVAATLPDIDDRKISVGMPVTVTMDGYPSLSFAGKIAAVGAVAQESRRQSLRRHFQVLVELDRLDLDRMRPGLSARAVVDRGTVQNALLVPRAALDFAGRAPRARVDGGAMKEVKLGPCNALECVVREGLAEGQRLSPVVEVTNG
jgi:HlyD family secretion protein